MAPVTTLMRQKAMTAAKAPPAFSFAQEPPMAAANRMCRFPMIAQPIWAMVLPAMRPKPSGKHIVRMLPRLIIRPAAGMTAITVMRDLPSFCRKSKSMGNFFLAEGAAAAALPAGCASEGSAFCASPSAAAAASTLISAVMISSPWRISPVFTEKLPSSAPSVTSTGVTVLMPFDFRKSISAVQRS